VTATTDSAAIYLALLDAPGDWATMNILADALEDEGELALARAFRWAAEHDRWPTKDGLDWYGWWSKSSWDYDSVPLAARLPDELYDVLRRETSGHPSGGVREAFVRLSKALETAG
jgi:hypothetical protein